MIAQTAEFYVEPRKFKLKLATLDLKQVVDECLKGKENAMKAFYEHFHGYALSVCLSYSENRDDALEIMNDGFLKVFKSLDKIQLESIKPWIRKVMINGAIDHYRKNIHNKTTDLNENFIESNYGDDSVLAKLSSEDILNAIQLLPSNLRIVFNLYVVEGYSHKEIGDMLKIAESTSRANLSLANGLLRKKLSKLL